MKAKKLFLTMLCLSGIIIGQSVYATDYTLGTERIDITEPGSHSITGKGSGECTV